MKLLSFFLSLFVFVGCATSVNFEKSTVLPAAELSGKIKKDKNDNYLMIIKGAHIAKPSDLNPPKAFYVLWMETEKGAINLGKLKIDKDLKTSLSTVNSSKPKRLFITAEEDITVQIPGTQTVVSSEQIQLK